MTAGTRAVLWKELRELRARPLVPLVHLVFAAGLPWASLVGDPEGALRLVHDGRAMAAAFLLLAASVHTMDVFLGDPRRGTLGALRVTPLRGREIRTGKRIAAGLPALVVGPLAFTGFVLVGGAVGRIGPDAWAAAAASGALLLALAACAVASGERLALRFRSVRIAQNVHGLLWAPVALSLIDGTLVPPPLRAATARVVDRMGAVAVLWGVAAALAVGAVLLARGGRRRARPRGGRRTRASVRCRGKDGSPT